MFSRIKKFFSPPFFEGDEDKTRQGRLLSAVLLLDAAGISLMLAINLFSGNAPYHILLLEFAAVLMLLAFRLPMHRGKVTGASYGAVYFFVILISTALLSLGTTRDPTLGGFVLLVVTAGLLLNRRAILVLTGVCVLAVTTVMIAEKSGWLPAPRMTITLSDWGMMTVLLIVSAWAALWFREGIEKSLFRARQELAERIKAEEALRASEERFKNLSSMASEGILIHEDGCVRDANLAFARMIGYSNPDDLVGKQGLKLIPFAAESRRRVLDHMSSGSAETYEIEFVRADGSLLSAETHGKDIIHNGRPMRLVSMRDITERKRAEKLREILFEIANVANTATSLNALFHSIHESIGVLLPVQNFYLALYHPDREEISFPYFVDQYDAPPPPHKSGRGLTEYVLRTGAPLLAPPDVFESLARRGEVELIGEKAVDWLGVPLRTGDRTIGVMVVQSYSEKIRFGQRELEILSFVSAQIAMVIARKQAEETLRRSEEYFRSLIEKGSDIISVMDTNSIIQYISPSVERILGYKPEDLIGTSGFALVHPEDLKRLSAREDFLNILGAPGSLSPTIELRDLHKDGTWREMEAVARSITDANGELAIVTTARDITERKQAEATIRASLAEKEILLREIHHRVKNNMQIVSSLFNLQTEYIADEGARRMLKEGQLRIRSMALIHEQLYMARDLSKIEFASYLRSLTSHLFGFFKVDRAQVRLDTDIEDVRLDINTAVPCGLLFNELMTNVLKHAFPEGRSGTVLVTLRREKDGILKLCVKDDGVGFPDSLDIRGAASFGLQIVNLLLDQLDASIEIDRTNGTAFTITFRELVYKART